MTTNPRSSSVHAGEVHNSALDYLLKPIEADRLKQSIGRVSSLIKGRNVDLLNQRIESLLDELRPRLSYLERIMVKQSGRINFIPVTDIDWIEAADNYASIHVGQSSHLVLGTMSRLQTRLDPKQFLRIHRSTIVNVLKIKQLQPLFHGEYSITLQNGTELTSSRGYKDSLQKIVDETF